LLAVFVAGLMVGRTPEFLGKKIRATQMKLVLAYVLAIGVRPAVRTTGPTFVAFLLGVIVIVGGLIYFPMLILGPIGERIIG
jgi:K+-transporting ATPase ATPase A chain